MGRKNQARLLRCLLSCVSIAFFALQGICADPVPIKEAELQVMQTIEDFHVMLSIAAWSRGLDVSYRGPTASPGRGPVVHVKAATWFLSRRARNPEETFIAEIRIVLKEMPTFIDLDGRRLYLEYLGSDEAPFPADERWQEIGVTPRQLTREIQSSDDVLKKLRNHRPSPLPK